MANKVQRESFSGTNMHVQESQSFHLSVCSLSLSVWSTSLDVYLRLFHVPSVLTSSCQPAVSESRVGAHGPHGLACSSSPSPGILLLCYQVPVLSGTGSRHVVQACVARWPVSPNAPVQLSTSSALITAHVRSKAVDVTYHSALMSNHDRDTVHRRHIDLSWNRACVKSLTVGDS